MAASPQTDTWQAMFADAETIARYVDGPPRFMPGYHDVQKMAGVLLAEQMPASANVLVLGAGGGLEIKSFGQAYPDWCFVGIDPSPQMLGLAKHTLGELMSRTTLIEGTIDAAPSSSFDGATCLLTLHFLDKAERLRTLKRVKASLKRNAPFVVAHSSFPTGEPEREQWIKRYAAFARQAGAPEDTVAIALEKVRENLAVLPPEEDVELLAAAGFSNITAFYHAFTWRGWVCTAA